MGGVDFFHLLLDVVPSSFFFWGGAAFLRFLWVGLVFPSLLLGGWLGVGLGVGRVVWGGGRAFLLGVGGWPFFLAAGFGPFFLWLEVGLCGLLGCSVVGLGVGFVVGSDGRWCVGCLDCCWVGCWVGRAVGCRFLVCLWPCLCVCVFVYVSVSVFVGVCVCVHVWSQRTESECWDMSTCNRK